jgi:hypothetical protein
MASFSQTIRTWWRTATGRQPPGAIDRPAVIVHDPDADRPHDLDDPFFDPDVQSRIASIISDQAKKKH